DRLETGLPSGEIRAEGHGDFVVPLRTDPWFYRASGRS
ncbi:MAG: hypothetical protein ACI9MB_000478, partial [Verrucomicrobiales bacterium]